uniref:Uncharacterized protein n=1 Tax=Anguilla anguilla TaxID=7936 RepID=A0A0E9WRR7_ANGAN
MVHTTFMQAAYSYQTTVTMSRLFKNSSFNKIMSCRERKKIIFIRTVYRTATGQTHAFGCWSCQKSFPPSSSKVNVAMVTSILESRK